VLAIGYDRFAIAEQSVACALGEDYPQMPPGTEEMCLGVPSCTDLPGGWHVSLEAVPADAVPGDALCLEDAWRAYLDISQCQEGLVLRTRREGERMQPLGMAGHSKKINELMINLKLPKSVRERYPVLACQGAAGPVLWLPGLRLDERARVSAGSKRVIVARMWKG
jgi:tRNA(Ile)-lysidine synthetase-like protein